MVLNKLITIIFISVLAGCAAGTTGSMNKSKINGDSSKPYSENAEVPLATNFPTSMQKKLQAAEHWKRAANYSAAELAKSLTKTGTCYGDYACRTLVIKRQCSTSGCQPTACETTFGKIFHNEFVTAMVNLGYRVSTQPVADGVTLEIDVQTVSFGQNRPQYRYAGKKVEIGDGVWALKDVTTVMDPNGVPVKPESGSKLNWYRTEFATGKTPTTEIIVTVSALSAEKMYIGRSTDVYYVADEDSSHYACAKPDDTLKSFDEKTWQIKVNGDCTAPRCKSLQ